VKYTRAEIEATRLVAKNIEGQIYPFFKSAFPDAKFVSITRDGSQLREQAASRSRPLGAHAGESIETRSATWSSSPSSTRRLHARSIRGPDGAPLEHIPRISSFSASFSPNRVPAWRRRVHRAREDPAAGRRYRPEKTGFPKRLMPTSCSRRQQPGPRGFRSRLQGVPALAGPVMEELRYI